MKLLVLSTILSSAAAFAPQMGAGHIRTSLAASSADEAIQAALESSKKYGATSVEARLAWETVEEINASDNRYVALTCLFQRHAQIDDDSDC